MFLWQRCLVHNLPFVATAVIGSAAIGAGSSMMNSASNNEATTQAANQNNARLQNQYNQTRSDLQPYNAAGINAADDMTMNLQSLETPISMSEATLQNTPGYQFNLQQGLKATQNSAASRGLAASGAAMKGAASYATGLADSTYQNQFNNANTNQTNAYNRLLGVMGVGENAAAGTASANNAITQGQVNNTTSATNAINSNNTASTNALSNAANNIGGYYSYQGMYGNNSSNGNATGSWNGLTNALNGGMPA